MRNTREIIIEKIKAGEVVMRPRWHFACQTIFWTLGLIVVSLVALYLTSFLMFVLHSSGMRFMPLFGYRGIAFAVISSPWVLISATFLFVAVLYVLVRKFSFSYRKPVVYSLLATVFGVLLVSTMIHFLEIHSRMYTFSERHSIPGISKMYQSLPLPPEGVYAGRVSRIVSESTFIVQNKSEEVTVFVDAMTKMPKSEIREGLFVVIFGNKNKEQAEIQAFGVRIVSDQSMRHMVDRFTERELPEPGVR